ncbi:MAG TPA: Z1 domain-containing protein [Mycobacteriales bacterium]|nr:Z1 domain-containing protein [Mycobacteriales bacterium]
MTSDGELSQLEIETWLKVIRAGMSGSMTFEQALSLVPDDYRAAVEGRWISDHVKIEPVGVLSDGGPRPWFEDWDPADGYHWGRLRDFLLIEKGRSESVIESLDLTTDKILSMLEDPRPEGPPSSKVQGLVVGYVQSGKTANFSALIAKAYDAGFRIVIVLSGLHNSLRRQTQLRLEDELGLVAPTPGRPGVGFPIEGQTIVPMTGAETWQDFHPGTVDAALLQGNVRLILVVKKNASVLRRLVRWLEERQPITPPVLVIDDEADQASINTGGNRPEPLAELLDLSDEDVDDGTSSQKAQEEETDPSVINGLIRRLLDRMRRVAYVGYTATPFANVLIDKDALDREVGADLYPADFIVSLPRPPGYVGTERLFGRAELAGEDAGVEPLDVIREVSDSDADLLNPGRQGAPVSVLPGSMETALLDFILAMAARDTRVGGQPASSMLIHGSPYTYQQLAIADEVRKALASLRQQWRYDNEQARPRFQERWESEFVPVSERIGPERLRAFDDIEPAIQRIFRSEVPVLCLNTRTRDELDYEQHPNLRAVVVGGNKLSRGLTVEGLLVSYYIRPANYFDTLLQMARWFGYREDYVDLTRLYTTGELRVRFRDLATAEEALRREIYLYEALNKTPRDFAPRIMAHATMQITAKNRMGSGREITTDYNGSLIQTTLFYLRRKDWLQENLDHTREFLSRIGAPNVEGQDGLPTWRDVDWRHVTELLSRYKTHNESTRFSSGQLLEYVHAQASKHRELTRWHVGVRGRQQKADSLGTENLNIPGWAEVNCINRSREPQSEISIGTLVNPVSRGSRGGDEEIGLTDVDVDWARKWSLEQKVSYALALRHRRHPDEGALLVYPISRYSTPLRGDGQNLFDDPDRDGVTVVGLAAVLPYSTSEATVRFYVGSAGAVNV